VSAALLRPFELTVWREFCAVARSWRDHPSQRTADMLTRWGRLAYKTPIPFRDDDMAMRRVLNATEAAKLFQTAPPAERDHLWARIEPALAPLEASAGPAPESAPSPPAPAPEAPEPYYLRD
jgi:hypothetical protein